MAENKAVQNGNSYYVYPVIDDEPGHEGALPIYVYGIGYSESERHVIRNKGYSHPQIIYTVNGEGTLIVDGVTYTVAPNTGFYIPANVPHEYYGSSDEDWSTKWVVLAGFAVEETLTNLGLTKACVVSLGNISRIDKLATEMYYLIIRDNFYGSMTAAGVLYSFLLEFFKCTSNKGKIENLSAKSPLNKVLAYIDLHFADNLTLDGMCSVADVSPQHLCRLFRRKLSIRPMEYIAKKRIQEAKALLLNSPRNIAEISRIVGYNNCNYFCITFKKYEGVSPTEYRKTMG